MLPNVRAVLFFLVLAVSSTEGAVKKTRKRVVCYYTNWSVYRLGLAKFLPNNINPHLCTHLIYAFGGFNDDFELQPFDKYQDIDKGGYARFNGLKQYNKGLRTLLALGGWNEGSSRFSELVADPEYRKRFIYSAIRYLRQYNFDGLDLDWEYPGSRGGSDPADKENYVKLCQELRVAFDEESVRSNRPVLLLTIAVPAGISTIDKGFNIAALNQQVDFFNILAYDYHASSEPLTDHHAPLLAPPGSSQFDYRSELNVDYTVRYYLKLGAERRKLVVGIPTYGRSYTLIDANFNDLQAAAESPGVKGKHTKEDGYLSFYEVCELIAVDDWKVFRPLPEVMGPYATKDKQWVGYDDEFAVAKKAEYVRDNFLGGIMFWSVDNDDFRGRCSGKPYPLIEAAKKAYLSPRQGSLPKQEKGPTPPPPPTPDPDADFECKREGFYPHPQQCNKYFWCLGGGPLGIVPHSFTCPTGLLFNRNTDACDFPRSVKCKIKQKEAESITFPPTKKPVITRAPVITGSTANPFDAFYEEYDTNDLPDLSLDDSDPFSAIDLSPPVRPSTFSTSNNVLGGSRGGQAVATIPPEPEESDPAELKQLLALITNLGGVEGVEKLLAGDQPTSSKITEKDRRTLQRIVGKQKERTISTSPGLTRNKASVRNRPPPRTPARTRISSLKSPAVQETGRGPTNTRRQPTGTSSAAGREESESIRRRRPQYTSIQRDRSSSSSLNTNEEVIENSPVQKQYTSIERNRIRSELVEEDNSPLPARQYVTLNRNAASSEAAAPQPSVVEEDFPSPKVVARRFDSTDAGVASLPALAALTLTGISDPNTIQQPRRLVPLDADSVFAASSEARVARRRTLLSSDSTAVDRIGEPTKQSDDKVVTLRLRNRGTKRFSLRRNYRRRKLTSISTTTTETPSFFSTADKRYDTISSDRTVTADPVTAQTFVTTEKLPVRVRGAGRFFRFGGRTNTPRTKIRSNNRVESNQSQTGVELKLISGKEAQLNLKESNIDDLWEELSGSQKRDNYALQTQERSRIIARKVPQRNENDIRPNSWTNSNVFTSKKPETVPHINTKSFSVKRPDPLTHNRSSKHRKSDLSTASQATLTPKPTEQTQLLDTTEIAAKKNENDVTSTETSAKTMTVSPGSPFSRTLSKSRVRPFPFRPRSHKHNNTLLEKQPESIKKSAAKTGKEYSFLHEEKAETTEGYVTTTQRMADTKHTDTTASPYHPTIKVFQISTLPSRRSSTLRPPYRTRPTSSVSLYDLVNNRDEESKRLHVKSLIDQLKSSLHAKPLGGGNGGDEHTKAATAKTEQQSTNSGAGRNQLSISASVSNVEHRSTVSISSDSNLNSSSSTNKISSKFMSSTPPMSKQSTASVPTLAPTTFTSPPPTALHPVYSPTTNAERVETLVTWPSVGSTSDQVLPATSSREGRLFFASTSPNPPTLSYATAKDGVLIVTAATLPPPPSDTKSFVSVKVSVSSSSDSQSVETQPLVPSTAASISTQSPVDALFNMLSRHRSEPAEEESGRAERLDGPLVHAAMINRKPTASQSRATSNVTPRYDSVGILAFSTVTPRFHDSDSLFKRKTYISGCRVVQSSQLVTSTALIAVLIRHLWL